MLSLLVNFFVLPAGQEQQMANQMVYSLSTLSQTTKISKLLAIAKKRIMKKY